MNIFRTLYPELVEKNTIKYPIEDRLILSMPELHYSSFLKPAPPLKAVLLKDIEFENLLYIWEFFNNFSDFLDIPIFNLSELQASLNFVDKPDDVEKHFEREIESS